WSNDEQLVARKQDYFAAKAQMDQSKARLEMLESGPWKCDLELSQCAVRQAEAQRALVKTEMNRLTVRARIDGQVLQLNVRPGEAVGPASRALAIIGNVDV